MLYNFMLYNLATLILFATLGTTIQFLFWPFRPGLRR